MNNQNIFSNKFDLFWTTLFSYKSFIRLFPSHEQIKRTFVKFAFTKCYFKASVTF